MKPREYVIKYNFANGGIDSFTKERKNQFIVDLESDFDMLLKMNDGTERLDKFKQCVHQIRQKWIAIDKKIINGRLTDAFWNYFYREVIVDRRKIFFPDFQKKVEERRSNYGG